MTTDIVVTGNVWKCILMCENIDSPSPNHFRSFRFVELSVKTNFIMASWRHCHYHVPLNFIGRVSYSGEYNSTWKPLSWLLNTHLCNPVIGWYWRILCDDWWILNPVNLWLVDSNICKPMIGRYVTLQTYDWWILTLVDKPMIRGYAPMQSWDGAAQFLNWRLSNFCNYCVVSWLLFWFNDELVCNVTLCYKFSQHVTICEISHTFYYEFTSVTTVTMSSLKKWNV